MKKFKIQEAADSVGCSPSAIYKAMSDGKITACTTDTPTAVSFERINGKLHLLSPTKTFLRGFLSEIVPKRRLTRKRSPKSDRAGLNSVIEFVRLEPSKRELLLKIAEHDTELIQFTLDLLKETSS